MDWITAREADEALDRNFVTRRTLCNRAKDGVVRTMAHTFFQGARRQQSVAIPAEFWWAGGHDALTQDWIAGDFSTWIERREEWRAYGVRFSRNDLLEMGLDLSGSRNIGEGSISDFAHGFDTFDRAKWDYIEVGAWIVLRSADAVNGVSGFRSVSSDKRHETEAAAAYMLALQDSRKLAIGYERLAELCLRGEIRSWGRLDGADLSPIPPEMWDDTTLYLHQGEYWLVPKRLFGQASALRRSQWSALRFDAVQVRRSFPGAADQNERITFANRRGRKPGVGGFAASDAPLVEKMRIAVVGGMSAWSAAMALVTEAEGGGTDEAKAKRLTGRFQEVYDERGQPLC